MFLYLPCRHAGALSAYKHDCVCQRARVVWTGPHSVRAIAPYLSAAYTINISPVDVAPSTFPPRPFATGVRTSCPTHHAGSAAERRASDAGAPRAADASAYRTVASARCWPFPRANATAVPRADMHSHYPSASFYTYRGDLTRTTCLSSNHHPTTRHQPVIERRALPPERLSRSRL